MRDTSAMPKSDHTLTDAERDQYMELVAAHGLERIKNFGRDFKEDDYLVGAMVAFEYFNAFDRVPASWVIGLMSGGSPLTGTRHEPEEVRCGNPRCEETDYAYDREGVPDGWAVLQLSRSNRTRCCSQRCLRLVVQRLGD